MVKGSVKNTKTGLIKAFNNPKTTATVSAVNTPSTRTPFIKQDKTITKMAVTNILINNFITIY